MFKDCKETSNTFKQVWLEICKIHNCSKLVHQSISGTLQTIDFSSVILQIEKDANAKSWRDKVWISGER